MSQQREALTKAHGLTERAIAVAEKANAMCKEAIAELYEERAKYERLQQSAVGWQERIEHLIRERDEARERAANAELVAQACKAELARRDEPETNDDLRSRIAFHQTQATLLTQELIGDPMKPVGILAAPPAPGGKDG